MAKQKPPKSCPPNYGNTKIGDCIGGYANWLGKYYGLLWLGLGLVLAAAASGLPRLQLSVDTQKFFLQRDENALVVREFEQKYQIGENVGIYANAPPDSGSSLLEARQLDRLSLLSRELEQLPFVRSVQSLGNLWLQSRGDSHTERLENFRSSVAQFPEIAALHSQDWQSLWLIVELYPYDSYISRLQKEPADRPLLDKAKLDDFLAYLQQKEPESRKATEVTDQLQLSLPAILRQNQLETVGQLQSLLSDSGGSIRPGNILAMLLEQLLEPYRQNRQGSPPSNISGAELPGLNLIPVGIPLNSYRLEKELSADLAKVLGIAALLCLICIFLLMPSFLAAFAALLCVLGNVLLVFGLSGWLGLAVDKTFVMIPILLGFASSISYCVHIEKSWEKHLAKDSGASQAILAQSLQENLRPLSFAALTTVMSLLSFITVPIPMIQIAGLQSAIAVSLSYILALSLFCSICYWGRLRRSPAQGNQQDHQQDHQQGKQQKLPAPKQRGKKLQDTVYTPIIAVSLLCYRHRRLSLVVAATLLLGSLLLLPHLRVDLSTESVLGKRFHYVRQLMQVSGSEIGAGGFYNIDLLFGDEPLQEQHLLQIQDLEQRLRHSDLVKNVTSAVDFIQSVQRIYRGSSDLPASTQQAQQALLVWERLFGGQQGQWYSKEAQSLRIFVQVRQGSSRENIAHMDEVRHLASQAFAANSGVRVRPLGGVFQLAIMNQYITTGLLRSFSLSLLFVAMLLFALLGSLRLGLIALLPNLFPVLLTGAAIVLLGRQLEFVSMTVAPMVIGLAVDDTIYFLGHVQRLLRFEEAGQLATWNKKSRSRRKVYSPAVLDKVLKHSLYQIAPALITTTLILCVLFASLLLSDAANIRYMGLYTIIAMLAALFSDLLLTPILLRQAYGRAYRQKLQ